MNKYIGKEQVTATTMTYGEAYKAGLIPKNAYIEEYSENEGYRVCYEDGCENWSPKDVFEKTYKCSETPFDRLHIELKELYDKSDKLAAFIDSGNADKVVKNDYHSFLLRLQQAVMSDYIKVLEFRVMCFSDAPYNAFSKMSFAAAIQALKLGFAVRRHDWNKYQCVIKQIPAYIDKDIIPKMQSLPQSAKNLILECSGSIDYTDQCLVYNAETGRADSWSPSVSDIFANDWEIIM